MTDADGSAVMRIVCAAFIAFAEYVSLSSLATLSVTMVSSSMSLWPCSSTCKSASLAVVAECACVEAALLCPCAFNHEHAAPIDGVQHATCALR